MIQLVPGYNAVRWTGLGQPLATVAFSALLIKAFAHNPTTGRGFIGYMQGDAYPTLSAFVPGADYLLDVSARYALADAAPAPTGAFTAFAGYTPASSDTPTTVVDAPAAPTSVVISVTAADSVVAGRLVGRVSAGVIHYDATSLDHRQRLVGVALNSALAGGAVAVQQRGTVLIPGLGLAAAGDTLFAGADGQLAPNTAEGMAFHHIVGRTLSPDSFFLNPQTTYAL